MAMSVEINLINLTNSVCARLQFLSERVSFGLLASKACEEQAVRMPDAFFVVHPSREFSSIKQEFEKWLPAIGVREIVECIEHALNEACVVLEVTCEIEEGKVEGTRWNEAMTRFQGFQWKGVIRKLDYLKQNRGFIPELRDEIRSLAVLRNCLVHRNGLVGIPDVDIAEQAMTIRWRKPVLFVERDGVRVDIDSGFYVEGGEKLTFTHEQTSNDYKIGEYVQIDRKMFLELIHTSILFVHSLAHDVGELAVQRTNR